MHPQKTAEKFLRHSNIDINIAQQFQQNFWSCQRPDGLTFNIHRMGNSQIEICQYSYKEHVKFIKFIH